MGTISPSTAAPHAATFGQLLLLALLLLTRTVAALDLGMKSTIILVALFYTAAVQTQQAEKLTHNPCISRTTCHECIQTPTCAWCFDPLFEDRKRCYQPASEFNTKNPICRDEYTWNPENELKLIMYRELSKAHSGGGTAGGSWAAGGSGSASASASASVSGSGSISSSGSASEIVQVSPQHVSLKLRIKEPYRISMQYTQAEDYPVDLYYLMNLSKSMEDDKYKLSSLGHLLAESMQNITSGFRLGFGSFVDKVVMPYVSSVPEDLKEPCEQCAAPYGFHHVMTLSQNAQLFATMVEYAAVSGNLDDPEGGFDAIMQAIVCWKEIGWREKARRLLVVSTDAGFHHAGDGKLGGIIKPNDGRCHLDSKNGYYTHSSLQDYPSISQINVKVKENAINVIFAVTEEQIEVYKQLEAYIEGSSSGKLSADSANVVDLIKEQYQQILSSVELKDNAMSGIRVSYYSSCLNSGGPLKQTNKCENITVGDVVTFSVEIEVTACPKNPKDWKQKFEIYPVGIKESLRIDLEMLCSCPCEHEGQVGYKIDAQECSFRGIYKCGICECYPSYFGRHCECYEIGATQMNYTQKCRPDDMTAVDCSGRGICICGECICKMRKDGNEVISGEFCECDNFSCERHKGDLCSGPDHGVCVCGECQCLSPWSGSACSCRASNDTCYQPNVEDAQICSGHGECVCGHCECNNVRYSGKYCEKCPTCPGHCSESKECVQCQMYKTGPLTEDECAANCTFVPIAVYKIEAGEDEYENLCVYYDEDDCRFAYVYRYDEDNRIVVKAQAERECPPKGENPI